MAVCLAPLGCGMRSGDEDEDEDEDEEEEEEEEEGGVI